MGSARSRSSWAMAPLILPRLCHPSTAISQILCRVSVIPTGLDRFFAEFPRISSASGPHPGLTPLAPCGSRRSDWSVSSSAVCQGSSWMPNRDCSLALERTELCGRAAGVGYALVSNRRELGSFGAQQLRGARENGLGESEPGRRSRASHMIEAGPRSRVAEFAAQDSAYDGMRGCG